MKTKLTKQTLREYWAKVLPTIIDREVMLVHRDSDITWGRFYIVGYEPSGNGQFEITLLTSNTRITINEDNPWLVKTQD